MHDWVIFYIFTMMCLIKETGSADWCLSCRGCFIFVKRFR